MKKIFWMVPLTVAFLAAAMAPAQETDSKKPASPPQVMGPMMGTMGEGSPMKSMDHGAMMEMMQKMYGMQGMEGMAQMIEKCRQMMAGAHATEPSSDR